MTREELIEKAARAMHQHGLDYGGEHAEWVDLPYHVRAQYLDSAGAALDAVLPLVLTTWETEA